MSPPASTDSLNGYAWASTGVREILRRELYRGRVTYGKTRWEDRGETKVKVPVPDASQWITRTDDSLRIVSDELWDAAHQRMAQTHAVYLRRASGKLGGKPESGLKSKFLLSGFLRCGVCGGNLIISKKTSQRGRSQTAYVRSEAALHLRVQGRGISLRTSRGVNFCKFGCGPNGIRTRV